jgi:hypothetical protein
MLMEAWPSSVVVPLQIKSTISFLGKISDFAKDHFVCFQNFPYFE